MLSAPPRARKSMLSTSSRSMRHVGDVAEEQDAPAVGGDVDVLADVRAEEQHLVGAVLALERVVAVARVPLEDVVAGAHEGDVVAVVAEQEVVARRRRGTRRRPESRAGVSSPAPPSTVSLITPAGRVVAVTPSSPPSALMTSASLAPSELAMFTCAASPSTDAEVPAPKTSMMSSPLVPLTMTVSAWASPAVPPMVPARSRVDLDDVGARTGR